MFAPASACTGYPLGELGPEDNRSDPPYDTFLLEYLLVSSWAQLATSTLGIGIHSLLVFEVHLNRCTSSTVAIARGSISQIIALP